MRHLGSLLLSVFLAPIIWVLTGVGLIKHLENRATIPDLPVDAALGAGMLLVAGILYALLIMLRLSPIGPAFVGLAYLGMSGWAVLDTPSLYQTLPSGILGTNGALTLPAGGFAALLAVPLLATVVSPRRWRRYDRMPALYAGQASTGTGQPPHYAGQPPHYAGQPAPAGPTPTGAGPYPPGGSGHYPPGGIGSYPPAPPAGPPTMVTGPPTMVTGPPSMARPDQQFPAGGPAGWPPPGPPPRPVEEETTTRLIPGRSSPQPTEELGDKTRPLTAAPPPSADPDATRQLPTPPADPDATRRL